MSIGFSIIGWMGALIYLLAYFLLGIHIISAEKSLFHILNALGGFCLVINSIHLKDAPNFVLNLLWAFIALYSIVQLARRTVKNQE